MGKRRRLRGTILVFAALVLGLAAAVFLYPFWIPYLARPVAERFGATYGTLERAGGGRFVLTDLVYTNANFTVRASKVEGFLPHVWFRKLGATNSEEAFLEVNGWKVLPAPDGTGEPAPDGKLSIYGEFKRIEGLLEKGTRWLPKATFLNGMVVAGGREFTFPLATLENGDLSVDGVWPEGAIPMAIKGKLGGAPYRLSYAMYPLDLRVRLEVYETNQAVAAKLTGFYKGNRLDGSAEFGPESGRLPRVASVRAPEFKLSAELLGLKGYSDLSGSFLADWRSNRYTTKLSAHAAPYLGKAALRAIEVRLAASGDTNAARIEKLEATMPGLKLALSDSVEVSYAGRMLGGEAELAIDAELGKLPWGQLEGQMQATVLLKPGERIPVFWVRARGTNLEAFNVRPDDLEVSARIAWPRLEELSIRAEIGTNAVATITGAADLAARSLDKIELALIGAFPSNALPGGISAGEIELRAQASGPLTNPAHAGEAQVRRLTAPGLEPLNLDFSWAGKLFAFDRFALQARAGPAVLKMAGTGTIDRRGTNFTFTELALAKGEEVYLGLAKPFGIRVSEGPRVVADELQLRGGTNREVSLGGSIEWPAAGDFRLRARNVNPELFQYFITRSLRGLEAPELAAAGGWSNGPFAGTLEGTIGLEEKRFGRLRARLNVRLDESGLSLTNLSVLDAAGEVLRADGFLPLSVYPGGADPVRVSRREEIDFRLRTEPSEHFWGVVGGLAKLNLSNPVVRLGLSGTVRQPAGELEFDAARIELRQTNRELPVVGPVSVRVALDEDVLKLERIDAQIEGEPVSISGRVELGTNFWTLRREEIGRYLLDRAALRVRAPEIDLAPFARFAPKYLAAQGRVEIDARMEPGRKLSGTVAVREVETRPIAKLGVVQQIGADLRLQGRELVIANLSGLIGGQRLAVTGTVDVAEEQLAKGYPGIDLAIRGKNVPLARNPDVILRSDLDLKVTNGTNAIPVVSGDVTLRDSFLLRDIATLVPGKVASPERRPPYFSIAQDPIDDWKLDLRVRGEHFMRLRSPFFHGVASANFHVTGTAQEPVALGEASIGSGRIIFPFASLAVRQALVSLTSENPYVPRVFVTAGGRAFGFDIRMEVEGSADEPVIEFSSVPALTSEQIILMLTTGQIPRADFGFTEQDRASKLAFFLGKSLWEKLHPGQPGEERLTIRSGQDITEQGRQTYEVEYKLSDRWSLVGEYDRFGALNANVKWKLFSR